VTPATYGNLSAWWDADFLGYADATPIDDASAKWTDRSGNNNHLIQATSGARPVLKTNIINGKKIVRFDGVNDVLAFTSTITTATNFTLVAVGLYTIAVGGTAWIFGNSGAGDRAIRTFTAGSVEQMQTVVGASGYNSSTVPIAHGTAHMLVWRRNGSTLSFRCNKTACSTGTDSNSFALNRIGTTNFGAFMQGDVGELIIYSAHRSDAECDNLYDNYLKAKFGLP